MYDPMNYTLIGTGNIAWFLAQRLSAAGIVCKGVYGRNAQSQQQLSTILSAPPIKLTEIRDEAGICICAVSDDAIPLFNNIFKDFQHLTLIHCSGTLPLDAFSSTHRGVLWPVYSIRKAHLPVLEERNIPIILQANSTVASTQLNALAQACSDNVHTLNDQEKAWLHLSAVMGNNFINHLVHIVFEICKQQQIPIDLIKPILKQTMQLASQSSDPAAMQTGPAIRNDQHTMQKHQDLLSAHPEWQAIYQSVSDSIRKLLTS
jgi:predicted short-subunit dehydrogenase-like oxidoreductase (DUF2520 family)